MEKELNFYREKKRLGDLNLTSVQLGELFPVSSSEVLSLIKSASDPTSILFSIFTNENLSSSYSEALNTWSRILYTLENLYQRISEFEQKGVSLKELREKEYI